MLLLYFFQVILYAPQHISFAQNGYLYIVESDGKMTNQIREVSTDGTINHYVGAKSKCNCQESDCKCYEPREVLATKNIAPLSNGNHSHTRQRLARHGHGQSTDLLYSSYVTRTWQIRQVRSAVSLKRRRSISSTDTDNMFPPKTSSLTSSFTTSRTTLILTTESWSKWLTITTMS